MDKNLQEGGADLFVGVMMAVFGVIGLILAGGARDAEMLVFGVSLAGFAVLFDAALVKRSLAARAMAASAGEAGGRAP